MSDDLLKFLGFEVTGLPEGIPAGKVWRGRTFGSEGKEVIVSVAPDAARVFIFENGVAMPLGVMSYADLVYTLSY